jgi:hypothetical protein
MSFRLFIYYCALGGGWAALLAWLTVRLAGLMAFESALLSTSMIAAVVGLLLAGVVGSLDALLNAGGGQRLIRVLVCLAVGLAGGLVGGFVGELLNQVGLPRFIGWMLVGAFIGASLGVYDLVRAMRAGSEKVSGTLPQSSTHLFGPIRKIRNGVLGGVLGGLIGGLLFSALHGATERNIVALPRSSLAVGFVILGTCIGFLIGLAQVILKEAWIRVESGFRPGREILLARAETVIGRAEGSDIGLFGDHGVERLHARIVQQADGYQLIDAGTPGGTFLNDRRLTWPCKLQSGDAIRIGSSILRFGERQKKET